MVEKTDQAAGMTRLGTLTGIASRDEQLVEVNDHLWVSKDISDSILVTTPEGNVVINAGMPGNGETHRHRFREVSEQPVEYLVITQCHGDHFGGVHDIRDPETRVITQEKFEECREYWRILDDFYKRRSGKLWGSVLGKRADVKSILRVSMMIPMPLMRPNDGSDCLRQSLNLFRVGRRIVATHFRLHVQEAEAFATISQRRDDRRFQGCWKIRPVRR